MPSTFFGLDIAISGMQTYQAALNTTAHNVSNIGTLGYTRQQALRKANTPISLGTSYGMVGTGVRVTGITQTRSVYYDNKFRYNSSIYGNYTAKNYYMSCIETYVYEADEKTGGLYMSFDNFFGSLSSLTSNVEDKVIREEAVQYADTFTTYLNQMANSFQTLQKEANFEIEVVTKQINAMAEKIASLNAQVTSLELRGEKANDLRDARNLLLDELSELVQVSVTETEAPEGNGLGQFIVRIGENVLVDTTIYKTIQLVPRTTKDNQNDAEGLYDLAWSDGNPFGIRNTDLGGRLQALLEVRDGNNKQAFQGKITDVIPGDATNPTKITITDTNVNNMLLLNIPESKGNITIGANDYEYESFEVMIDPDTGAYSYTFTLKPVSAARITLLENAASQEKSAQIGSNVDYKGIPYYMSLLNEFVRTFSASFNAVHKEGYDLSGNAGMDFFNAIDKVSGENYVFSDGGTFSSLINPDAQGTYYASYYSMTALNFSVTQELMDDPNKIAASSSGSNMGNDGVSNGENLLRLNRVKEDKNMFRQGTPDGFLQTLVSSVGIDANKAKTFMMSQANIVSAIDYQRTSISGVDEDEEAADLVKFQNLLFFQYKVISIMDEVFDKLINGTAV